MICLHNHRQGWLNSQEVRTCATNRRLRLPGKYLTIPISAFATFPSPIARSLYSRRLSRLMGE